MLGQEDGKRGRGEKTGKSKGEGGAGGGNRGTKREQADG
jgi:hypothetical protein